MLLSLFVLEQKLPNMSYDPFILKHYIQIQKILYVILRPMDNNTKDYLRVSFNQMHLGKMWGKTK